MDTLTDRMDVPILSSIVCVTSDTILNFDTDFDKHIDGDIRFEQTL